MAKYKALLIDDNTQFTESVKGYLLSQDRFSEVDTAQDGREALKKLREKTYDVMTLDLIMPNADGLAVLEQMVKNANVEEDPDALVGEEFTSQDAIRLIPDILKSGENFFFPVFTSAEEMGEYGDHFSKVQKHFLEAMNLAWNNERGVVGIVINAFSAPFVVPREVFAHIADMGSSLEEGN